MKLIGSSQNTVSLELKNEEFNFLRETLRELPGLIGDEELPTLTGYTKAQVKLLRESFREIAAEIALDL